MKNPLAVAAFVVAVLGMLWTAAEQWGDIKARVKHIEDAQQYLHGDIHVPGVK